MYRVRGSVGGEGRVWPGVLGEVASGQWSVVSCRNCLAPFAAAETVVSVELI